MASNLMTFEVNAFYQLGIPFSNPSQDEKCSRHTIFGQNVENCSGVSLYPTLKLVPLRTFNDLIESAHLEIILYVNGQYISQGQGFLDDLRRIPPICSRALVGTDGNFGQAK